VSLRSDHGLPVDKLRCAIDAGDPGNRARADSVAARDLSDRLYCFLSFQHLAPLVGCQLMGSAETLAPRLGASAPLTRLGPPAPPSQKRSLICGAPHMAEFERELIRARKAIPVILTTAEECETRLTAPVPEALVLQSTRRGIAHSCGAR
jgi:hypothetical protein